MSVKVKVCGITRKEDARVALDLGADYLGVNLYRRSPRAVPPSELGDLLSYIPAGKRVFIDVNTPTDELETYLNFHGDAYQLHFDLDVAIATVAAWAGIVGRERLWLAPKVPPEEAYFPQIIMEFADTVLLDTYSKSSYGGTGKTGDWQRFLDWSTLYSHKRWALAGGLDPQNIRQALEQTDPALVDVNSGVEVSPGIKDPLKLEALFQTVRQYNQARAQTATDEGN